MTVRSRRIDTLKAMAIFLVIFGHALNYYRSNIGTLSEPWALLRTTAMRVNVPLFLTVSGWLCHRQPIRSYARKKFLRLLVPFFFFVSLKIVSSIIIGRFLHGDTLMAQLVDGFLIGTPYWFVYAICWMYALAPFFWNSDFSVRSLAIAMVGFIFISIVVSFRGVSLPTWFQFNNAVPYIPYFLLGMLLQQNPEILSFFRSRKNILIPSALGCAILITLLNQTGIIDSRISNYLCVPCWMYCLYELAGVSPPMKFVDTAARYSLQLMFLDSFLKIILYTAAKRIIPMTPWLTLPLTLCNLLLGIFICRIAERIPPLRFLMGIPASSQK